MELGAAVLAAVLMLGAVDDLAACRSSARSRAAIAFSSDAKSPTWTRRSPIRRRTRHVLLRSLRWLMPVRSGSSCPHAGHVGCFMRYFLAGLDGAADAARLRLTSAHGPISP